MRIAHVNDIASVGSTLVHALSSLGHDARLIRLQLAGGSCGTLGKAFSLPERIAEMVRINREIKRLHFDVVHIHFAYLGTYGRVGRYEYFLHCHGSDVRLGLPSFARRGMTRAAMRDARAVFFSTPDLADAVQSVRPDAQYLPSPVRTDLFHPTERVAGPIPRILLISSLNPVKGVETAFAAIGEVLRTRACDVTAIFSGPLKERYRGMPGIKFIDPIPHEQMPRLIADADIVVGQFKIGSLGLAELESMACGKPVVAHVLPSPLYGSPPPLAAACDFETATRALLDLVDSVDLRRTMGSAAAAWIAARHDSIKVAKDLVRAYGT